MKHFDLLEYQHEAREASSAKELFQLWDHVCRFYERGHIGPYELDEMKTVIWPNLRTLSQLELMIDQAVQPG